MGFVKLFLRIFSPTPQLILYGPGPVVMVPGHDGMSHAAIRGDPLAWLVFIAINRLILAALYLAYVKIHRLLLQK